MRLYVNIDHVATLREARQTDEPDPVAAAAAAERGGADGITVHLREDRRHIQDAAVRALRARPGPVLNLELANHRRSSGWHAGCSRSRRRSSPNAAGRSPPKAGSRSANATVAWPTRFAASPPP